jgi:hypothetical protein
VTEGLIRECWEVGNKRPVYSLVDVLECISENKRNVDGW